MKRAVRIASVLGACLLSALAASVAFGQDVSAEPGSDLPAEASEDLVTRLLEDALPDGMGSDFRAYQGVLALRAGRNVRAREEAEAILAESPDSIAGHGLMAWVLHTAEGDLARARHHVDRALSLFDQAYPLGPTDDSPWYWHATSLQLLQRIESEMGRDAERLAAIDQQERWYGPVSAALRAWPLMRLGRYEEARRFAELALQMEDEGGAHDVARTSLCAIEAELWNRGAAWESCQRAVEHQTFGRDAVVSTNAAEAALEVLRFEDAERHARDATAHPTDSPSSPWAMLMQIYLGEGRYAEAADALPRMLGWFAAQTPRIRNQMRVFNELNAVSLLLVTGHLERAARLSARALQAPDRHGLSNEDIHSRMAALALLDHQVQRAAEQGIRERVAAAAGSGTWWDAARLLPGIARHRLAAWTSRRRAANWLADDRVLEATVRPYLADGAPIGEWQQLELAHALDRGLIEAMLERARANETWPGADAYLDAMAAELARARGDAAAAAPLVRVALATLPAAEVLMRARLLTTQAWAAEASGDDAQALAAWEQAWQLDPGVLRRSGAALPVRISASADPGASAVATRLRQSPRFEDRGFGFRLRVDGPEPLRACLFAASGALLACGSAEREADESAGRQARRVVDALHDAAFAPRVELAQRDLQSLDGSPTAAGRAGDSVRGALDAMGVLEAPPEAGGTPR